MIDESWVGKYARLKNGDKVYIVQILPAELGWLQPVVYLNPDSRDVEFDVYHLNGQFFTHPEGETDEYDIIGLWEESRGEPPLTNQELKQIRDMLDWYKKG